jgi:glycosyltransferase involved in cell wall biosynthesis
VVQGICHYQSSVTSAERVTFIPNPVDLQFFKPVPEELVKDFRQQHALHLAVPGKTVFLFSGALSIYRDLMTLMEALSIVFKKTRDFVFLLIGYGEDRERLQDYVRENGLKDHVIFLPFMERQELLKYICAADFCYFSASPDPIFDMAIPVKAIEYLACEKFLICAHSGDFPTELRNQGLALVAPPGNPHALAQTLIEAIQNRPMYRSTQNARTFATEVFSLEQFSRRYLDLCIRLLSISAASKGPASQSK